MNAKQIAWVAALMAAGAVSAQTVPAEAWVGPPIATVGGSANRADVVAELTRFMAQPQASQEAWAGTVASAGVEAGAAKRSEVVADLNLMIRAGLGNFGTRVYYEPFSAEEASRVALYKRLRNGPEFKQEVARLEGAGLPVVVTANASEASAD